MTTSSHITESEINLGLDHIQQSPTDNGLLRSIVIRPGSDLRVKLQECRLSPEGGTEGDQWARGCWLTLPDGKPHPDVQIAIINARLIDLLAGSFERWELAGDNLYVDLDLSRDNLAPGQRLQIGECVLEITNEEHKGCDKFRDRFGMDAVRFVNSPLGKQLRLRGIYAKVIQAGIVRVGDTIQKLAFDLKRKSP